MSNKYHVAYRIKDRGKHKECRRVEKAYGNDAIEAQTQFMKQFAGRHEQPEVISVLMIRRGLNLPKGMKVVAKVHDSVVIEAKKGMSNEVKDYAETLVGQGQPISVPVGATAISWQGKDASQG